MGPIRAGGDCKADAKSSPALAHWTWPSASLPPIQGDIFGTGSPTQHFGFADMLKDELLEKLVTVSTPSSSLIQGGGLNNSLWRKPEHHQTDHTGPIRSAESALLTPAHPVHVNPQYADTEEPQAPAFDAAKAEHELTEELHIDMKIRPTKEVRTKAIDKQ